MAVPDVPTLTHGMPTLKRRRLRAAIVCAVAVVMTACGHAANGSSASPPPAASAAIVSPTAGGSASPVVADSAAPLKPRKATRPQLGHLRSAWDGAISLLAAQADPVRARIATLLQKPGELRVATAASPNSTGLEKFPKSWQSTRAKLDAAAATITAARANLDAVIDGAKANDATRAALRATDRSIVDAMCAALADARKNYAAVGGYPNDLDYHLTSDRRDQPCTNVRMKHPYPSIVTRRAPAAFAEAAYESAQTNAEEALLQNRTGFVIPALTVVRVLAHRYSDTTETTLCRVQHGADTGWIPCGWLARSPLKIDG